MPLRAITRKAIRLFSYGRLERKMSPMSIFNTSAIVLFSETHELSPTLFRKTHNNNINNRMRKKIRMKRVSRVLMGELQSMHSALALASFYSLFICYGCNIYRCKQG